MKLNQAHTTRRCQAKITHLEIKAIMSYCNYLLFCIKAPKNLVTLNKQAKKKKSNNLFNMSQSYEG